MRVVHHPDELPGAEHIITTETMFGSEAAAFVRDQPHLDLACPNDPRVQVFHEESPDGDPKETNISNGENPFERHSFQGFGEHGAPANYGAIVTPPVFFNTEGTLPDVPEDISLIFGTKGPDMD